MTLAWLSAHAGALFTLADVALAGIATQHILLSKRDSRAAIGWVGLVWLAPVAGALLYWSIGINRIERRAAALMRDQRAYDRSETPARDAELNEPGQAGASPFRGLARATEQLARRPLLAGNAIAPLEDGDAAYPAMLHAIEQAQGSVALLAFIFDHDAAGERFAEALGRAVARGVAVRVLVDAVGARYSRSSIVKRLERDGVRVALFLPTANPLALPFANLRNHRKLLVTDGSVAFTGGMNIRHGHVLSEHPGHPVRDVHFRVEGPIVGELMDCFAEDWAFATGEVLAGAPWYREPTPAGAAFARAVSDGPDHDLDVMRYTILAALASAQQSVRIATPYFLPDASLIVALNIAALRGVAVDVVTPASVNVRLVQWASRALWWQILTRGCRIHLSPPPFDHTKLCVVDETWSLLGSTNWDERSFRLNFELNLEVHDAELGARLATLIDARIAQSRSISLAEVKSWGKLVRLRDAAARLLSPYL